MRTLAVYLTAIVLTPILSSVMIVAAWMGRPRRPGNVLESIPYRWAGILCRVAGVRLDVAGIEHTRGGPRIVVANHVSWFDVFALASTLRGFAFVAKAELGRIPFFGGAARAAGHVFIQRENRKAAFEKYNAAAAQVADGQSVIVFPEGTRGTTYALRPFKKGPFVLAISAGVPIVPTIVYGTREVFPKHALRVRPGAVTIRFLEPISTVGLAYEGRDELVRTVWRRMADALRAYHGVVSDSTTVPLPPHASILPT